MEYQLTVANSPSQVRRRRVAVRWAPRRLAGSLRGAPACGSSLTGGMVPAARRCTAPATHSTAAAAAAATLPPATASQVLAKTNRVFVSPDDPVAAIPFVQLGDL